jgi:hypothetical protein
MSEWRKRYEEVRERVSVLRAARNGGDDVDDGLAVAEETLRRLETGLRGYDRAYVIFVAWSALVVILTVHMWVCTEPVLIDMWGSHDNPYLQRYRSGAAAVWHVAQHVFRPWVLASCTLAVLSATWLLQRRLMRWYARSLLATFGALLTLLAVLFGVSRLSLFISPLMMSPK